jgi:tetratricopeptide (TPR) repeat protein
MKHFLVKEETVKSKLFSFIVAPVFLGAFSISLITNSYAQSEPPTPKPTPTPSPVRKGITTIINTPTPTPTPIQIPENPRERRALAYRKLLEGQRYILMLRYRPSAGSFIQIANAARNALQQAVILEPKLAEAYTALAELATQIPPQDLEEAIRYANQAIAASKDNLGAHLLLSRIYTVKSGLAQRQLNKKNADLAIQELQEVVRLDNNNAEAWAFLSEFYQRTGRKDDALTALKNWADAPTPFDGNDSDSFYKNVTGNLLTNDVATAKLGEALLREGKHSEAIAALSRSVYLNPENESVVELLIEAFNEGENGNSNAIIEIKRLVATNPTNIKLVKLLAETQSNAGNYNDAIKTLQNSLERFSDDDDSDEALNLKLALGQTYADGFFEKEAIAVYEEILKKSRIETKSMIYEDDKQMAEIIFSRIISLQKILGNFKGAETTIVRMRKVLGNDDSSADEESVELLRDQGKRTEALQSIRTVRQKFPQHLNLAIKEAQVLTDLNRVDEAVAMIRSKISSKAGFPIAHADIQLHLIISSLYSQANRGKEAVEAAQQAISFIPQNNQIIMHSALATLASAQEKASDFKNAEASLRRILSDKPKDATALNNLGYFLIERNERLEEALSMIQKAVRSEPNNSSFLDSLGWAYFKLGKYAEAEKYLSQAARRNPFSSTIQDHLGDVYQKLGKIEPARTAWQQALKLETDKNTLAKIKAKLQSKTLSMKQ